MNRLIGLMLSAVVLSSFAFGQAPNSTATAKIRAEVMKLEDEWVESRATKDPTITKSLLADDFVGCTPDGEAQTKQQFIDSVTAGTFAGRPEYRDRKLRLFGDTAISTGLVIGAGPSGTDKIRYIRVFAKRNGKWQLVGVQATRVTAAK